MGVPEMMQVLLLIASPWGNVGLAVQVAGLPETPGLFVTANVALYVTGLVYPVNTGGVAC